MVRGSTVRGFRSSDWRDWEATHDDRSAHLSAHLTRAFRLARLVLRGVSRRRKKRRFVLLLRRRRVSVRFRGRRLRRTRPTPPRADGRGVTRAASHPPGTRRGRLCSRRERRLGRRGGDVASRGRDDSRASSGRVSRSREGIARRRRRDIPRGTRRRVGTPREDVLRTATLDGGIVARVALGGILAPLSGGLACFSDGTFLLAGAARRRDGDEETRDGNRTRYLPAGVALLTLPDLRLAHVWELKGGTGARAFALQEDDTAIVVAGEDGSLSAVADPSLSIAS